jgi:hypothetical protein
MKLSNIFKKSTKTVAKATIETLAKNQLEKVIGGGDDTTTDATASKVKNGGTVRGTVVVNNGNL